MAKTRKTEQQEEKEKQLIELQAKLQELSNKKEKQLMSSFKEEWNKKNKEKITEMVKIQDRCIIRFNNSSVTITGGFIIG